MENYPNKTDEVIFLLDTGGVLIGKYIGMRSHAHYFSSKSGTKHSNIVGWVYVSEINFK